MLYLLRTESNMSIQIHSMIFTSSSTSLLLFTLLLSSITHPQHSLAEADHCNPHDRRALLRFNSHFGNKFPSWTANTDCCKHWDGVKCDPATHRIISVTTSGGDISGQLPDAIGDLPYLQILIFRKLSNLTGTIPQAVIRLKKLRYASLGWNSFSGPVPQFLAQIRSLEYLDLSFNKFSGTIPPSLSSLPNLGGLRLDRNMLTGSIPESFGSFKQSGFYLLLSHNRLSGAVPRSLGEAEFGFIDLSRNMLAGDASFLFGKNKSAQQVNLSRNMFSFDMSGIEFPTGLISFDVNHNHIYGNIPGGIAGLPMLQELNVSYNRLCGRIPVGGRMGGFDQFSYVHNKCLCGTPLQACE